METQNTNLEKDNNILCDQVLTESLETKTETPSKDNSQSNIAKESLEFLRIKQAVEESEDIDNTEKIMRLKKLIDDGMYDVDLDELSEKITKHLL